MVHIPIRYFLCFWYSTAPVVLVVRVLGYRSGGSGSIPGTTRFSERKKKEREQYWVWNGVHSAS
jgi:hypothetical protein